MIIFHNNYNLKNNISYNLSEFGISLPSAANLSELDIDFINDLPENVDACGENGEFHTFVYDGPIFKKPIEFFIGEKTKRNYTKEEKTNWDTSFWYIDLIPKNIR